MIHRDRTPRENEGKIIFYARSLSSFLLYHRSSRTDVLFFLGEGASSSSQVVVQREDDSKKSSVWKRGIKKRPLHFLQKCTVQEDHHPPPHQDDGLFL